MGVEDEDSIERAAEARRERLKALKAAQQLLSTPDEATQQQQQQQEQQANPNMKFRNYVPHDKQLQEGKVAPPAPPKFEDPVASVPPPTEEKKEDPFVNIAPKKPNWDLRRAVQPKLDKLERRTQKALYKLMEMQEKEKELAEERATEEGTRIDD